MGGNCGRRRITMRPNEDEDEWEVIPLQANRRSNERFKKAVKRIRTILLLRWLWARVGSYLNTAASRRLPGGRRAKIAAVWVSLGETVVKPYVRLFVHLKRHRGRLIHLSAT